MVDLMDMLKGMSKHKPGISQVLFASHPMSTERYDTAIQRIQSSYAPARKNPIYRERYMDHTANLRKIKSAIETMQKSEVAMAKKKYPEAEEDLKKALAQVPDDYAGLLMMSKCLLAQNKNSQAKHFADKAKQVYPQEAQAQHVSGVAAVRLKRFNEALHDFDQYERLLPGNPNTGFFKGLALEGMHQRPAAAQAYRRYLQQVRQGNMAKYAYQRLNQWGYIRK
jgi:tetratricopeptide (TPR) repeat protein